MSVVTRKSLQKGAEILTVHQLTYMKPVSQSNDQVVRHPLTFQPMMTHLWDNINAILLWQALQVMQPIWSIKPQMAS